MTGALATLSERRSGRPEQPGEHQVGRRAEGRVPARNGVADASVVVRERVVVGEPLPPTVVLHPVPNYTEYRYAVVNDRRVIVEPRTRKVIKIID